MIDFLKKVFFDEVDHTDNASAGVKVHDARVAACALFLEMANIDEEFSDQERDAILSILKKEYQLQDDHAEALLKSAGEQLEESLDLWTFTQIINKQFSIEEKIQVVEMLWKIVYADGKLDKHEDYMVHRMSELLNLDHNQLIDAKLKMLHSED